MGISLRVTVQAASVNEPTAADTPMAKKYRENNVASDCNSELHVSKSVVQDDVGSVSCVKSTLEEFSNSCERKSVSHP